MAPGSDGILCTDHQFGKRQCPQALTLCEGTVPFSDTRQGQQGAGLQGLECIFALILSQEGPGALLTSLPSSSVVECELALSCVLQKKRFHPCCVLHEHVCGERAVLCVRCDFVEKKKLALIFLNF